MITEKRMNRVEKCSKRNGTEITRLYIDDEPVDGVRAYLRRDVSPSWIELYPGDEAGAFEDMMERHGADMVDGAGVAVFGLLMTSDDFTSITLEGTYTQKAYNDGRGTLAQRLVLLGIPEEVK